MKQIVNDGQARGAGPVSMLWLYFLGRLLGVYWL